MKRYLPFFCIVFGLAIGLGDAQNMSPPTIRTTMEYPSGATIQVSYVARYWEGSRSNPNPQNIRSNFAETMGTIETNIQLQIGPVKMDPGQFNFGFAPESEDAWQLVLQRDGEVKARLPIAMREEQNIVNYFSVVLRPGRTDRDFIFTMLYGPRSTSLRWSLTGVPTRPADGAMATGRLGSPNQSPLKQGAIPDLGQSPAGSGSSNIPSGTQPVYSGFNPNRAEIQVPSATGSPQPQPKQKAGSGAFRRLLKMQEQTQQ